VFPLEGEPLSAVIRNNHLAYLSLRNISHSGGPMALGVTFPDSINVGDNLVVVVNSAGLALITTDISQSSSQQDLTTSQNVNLGAVSGPGVFGVLISTDTDSFASLITIVTSGVGSLAVLHDDVEGTLANPIDFTPAPAGGDAFDHFNQSLTVDILKRAVSKAVQDTRRKSHWRLVRLESSVLSPARLDNSKLLPKNLPMLLQLPWELSWRSV